MAKDFKAGQVKTSKIIGKTGEKTVFYTDAESTDDVGGNAVPVGGTDVSFVFSGEEGAKDGATGGVTLFTGDIVVSGTLYAEKQVIEVDESVQGTLFVSGSAVIEDNFTVNVDSFFVDSVTDRIGIGTATPNAKINVTSDASGETLVSIEQHNATVDAPNLEFVKSRGTYDAPLTITTGDFLGDVMFKAYDGNSEDVYARMYIESFGTISDVSHPGRFLFKAGADGVLTPTTSLALQGDRVAILDTTANITATDTNFLVAGIPGSKDSAVDRGTAVFEGDLVVSGSITDGTGAPVGFPSVGVAGLVQIAGVTPGEFAAADHLKYHTVDDRVWLGTSTVPVAYGAKLHVQSRNSDGVPTLMIETTGNSNTHPSLQIINESTNVATKIVKIDSVGNELFTIEKSGMAKLSHDVPKIEVSSSNTTATIKLESASPSVMNTTIFQNSGNFSIDNIGDGKIVEMVGTYGGGSPQKYNIIRGEVNGANSPTVVIQTDPTNIIGTAAAAIASNDINFYVEGSAGTLGTSSKASAQFGGDVKVNGCVARGAIAQFYISGLPQVYSELAGSYAAGGSPTNSIVWNANIVTDPTFYTQSGKDITILKAGIYKISYTINCKQIDPAANRINYQTAITLNPGAGSSLLPCSTAHAYGRGDGTLATVDLTTNTMTTIAIFAANDVINVDIRHIPGHTGTVSPAGDITFNILSSQSNILIEKVG